MKFALNLRTQQIHSHYNVRTNGYGDTPSACERTRARALHFTTASELSPKPAVLYRRVVFAVAASNIMNMRVVCGQFCAQIGSVRP